MPVIAPDKMDTLLAQTKAFYDKNPNPNTILRIEDIPTLDYIDTTSASNGKKRRLDERKMHPVRPKRGEIYLASITTGAGRELTGQHLVVIISNNKGNLYSDKVMIVPIEGDGSKINPSCHVQLLGSDLDSGRIDKSPSRIVAADIMTVDKARLQHRIGVVSAVKMKELDEKIKLQLSLN